MTNITYGDAIAIAELVFYAPFLLLSLPIALRHHKTSFAWFFLSAFCLVRVIGASARLDTINHASSNTAWTIALICSVFGLNPLLMATLGMLGRAFYDVESQARKMIFTGKSTNTLIHLPATAAVVLCIVGATSADTAGDIPKETSVKVGIVLFTVVFLLVAALAVFAWVVKSRTGQGEGLLIAAVLVSIPFLAVRLLYGLLSIFDSKSETFNLGHGNQTVALCMSVLEEMIVLAIFVLAGWKLSATSTRGARAGGAANGHDRERGELPPMHNAGWKRQANAGQQC